MNGGCKKATTTMTANGAEQLTTTTTHMMTSNNGHNVVMSGGSPGRATCCGCCPMPPSVVAKLNKLNARTGIFKFLGEFGLRESFYYGSIFLLLSLIGVVCFLVIHNRTGDVLSGTSAALFDSSEFSSWKYKRTFITLLD